MEEPKEKLDIKTALTIVSKAKEEISKVIVGQVDVIESFIIATIVGGHVLIEGAPGLAKTALVRTISTVFDCEFKRVQFTPDLLPSDIIGLNMYNKKTEKFYVEKGPIFTNLLLADEINRASSKVQSALLEAMAEGEVTIGGENFELKKPFFVFATENPVESLGTYALPQAQLDRFIFKIVIGFPDVEEEEVILNRIIAHSNLYKIELLKLLTPDQIVEVQAMIKKIYVDNKLEKYIVNIIDATRHPDVYKLKLGRFIEWGVGPRGTIALIMAAKGRAFLNGRDFVIDQDIRDIAYNVLRHRILLNYEAQAKKIDSLGVIDEILGKIKVF